MENFTLDSKLQIEAIRVLVQYDANAKEFDFDVLVISEEATFEVPMPTLDSSKFTTFDDEAFIDLIAECFLESLDDIYDYDIDDDVRSDIEYNFKDADAVIKYLNFDIVEVASADGIVQKIVPYIPFHASVNVSIRNSANFTVNVELNIKNMRDEAFSFKNTSLSFGLNNDHSLYLLHDNNTKLMHESEFYDNLINQIKLHITSFLGYNQVLCDSLIGNLENNIDVIYKDFLLEEREDGLALGFRFFEISKDQLFEKNNLGHPEYQIILTIQKIENALDITVYIPRCSYKPTYTLNTTNIELENSKAYADSIINFVKFKLSNDKNLANKVIECNNINAQNGISALPTFGDFFWLQNVNNISWIFISKNFTFPHYVDENVLFNDYLMPVAELTEKFTDEFLQLRETLNLTKEKFSEYTDYSNTLLSDIKKGEKNTSLMKLCFGFESLSDKSDFVESPHNKSKAKKS